MWCSPQIIANLLIVVESDSAAHAWSLPALGIGSSRGLTTAKTTFGHVSDSKPRVLAATTWLERPNWGSSPASCHLRMMTRSVVVSSARDALGDGAGVNEEIEMEITREYPNTGA